MPAAPLRTLQRGRLFALAPSLGLPGRSSRRSSRSMERERRLERETGIEPATNSLEGCDSTTELLPHPEPVRSCSPSPYRSVAAPRCFATLALAAARVSAPCLHQSPTTRQRCRPGNTGRRVPPPHQLSNRANFAPRGGKVGGEGRVRTSVGTRPADLQSAAIDRSATSPNCSRVPRQKTAAADASPRRVRPRLIFESVTVYCDAFLGVAGGSAVELAEGFEPPTG